jgi:hypothetical protein
MTRLERETIPASSAKQERQGKREQGDRATAWIRARRQLRTLDLRARNEKFSEKAPDFIVDEALAKVMALFK